MQQFAVTDDRFDLLDVGHVQCVDLDVLLVVASRNEIVANLFQPSFNRSNAGGADGDTSGFPGRLATTRHRPPKRLL